MKTPAIPCQCAFKLKYHFVPAGSALTCNECLYTSQLPKADQRCGNNTIVCPAATAYCYSVSYTIKDGTNVVVRNCDSDAKEKYCPDAEKSCRDKTKTGVVKSCAGFCCKTDQCNNYTPTGGSTGLLSAKLTLSVMIIAGLILP